MFETTKRLKVGHQGETEANGCWVFEHLEPQTIGLFLLEMAPLWSLKNKKPKGNRAIAGGSPKLRQIVTNPRSFWAVQSTGFEFYCSFLPRGKPQRGPLTLRNPSEDCSLQIWNWLASGYTLWVVVLKRNQTETTLFGGLHILFETNPWQSF